MSGDSETGLMVTVADLQHRLEALQCPYTVPNQPWLEQRLLQRGAPRLELIAWLLWRFNPHVCPSPAAVEPDGQLVLRLCHVVGACGPRDSSLVLARAGGQVPSLAAQAGFFDVLIGLVEARTFAETAPAREDGLQAAVAKNDTLLAAVSGEALETVLSEECRLFPADILSEAGVGQTPQNETASDILRNLESEAARLVSQLAEAQAEHKAVLATGGEASRVSVGPAPEKCQHSTTHGFCSCPALVPCTSHRSHCFPPPE